MPRVYGADHYLSDDKRKFAEENIKLMWYYVYHKLIPKGKVNNDNFEDVVSHLMWHYCIAVEKFNMDRKQALSTYAYKAFHSGYCRYKEVEVRFCSRFMTTSFQPDTNNDDLSSIQNSLEPSVEDKFEDEISWNRIYMRIITKSLLTDFEKRVIYEYNKQGKTFQAIGEETNYTRERIRQIHKVAVAKMRECVQNENMIMEDFIDLSEKTPTLVVGDESDLFERSENIFLFS